ncbi:MAG: hypothetical protein KL787_08845, partial [Taibaiella sp.]|nr:hypothetical protein [Taibaiella sp.]
MSEAKKTTTPRLLAAANEFNIGKDTLIDFLTKKGFEIDSKPSTKLTEEMYYALEDEYAKDKAEKRKSESIELPKGSLVSQVSLADDKKVKTVGENKIELETPTISVGKQDTAKKKEITRKEDVAEPAEKIPVAEIPDPQAAAPEPEEQQPSAGEQDENQPSGHIETEAPKLGGPKVVDKIDLDAINQSTRPAKKAKVAKAAEDKPEAPATSKDDEPSKVKKEPQAEETGQKSAVPPPVQAQNTK